MVVDELIPIIKQKFQKGQRRSEIKEDLFNDGYNEEDIEDTMARIQYDAVKQLPGISSIYKLIEDFEKKSNLTTTRMTLLLMVACVGVLLVLAIGLYLTFDPLGTGAQARDAQRSSDAAKIQTALGFYYQQHGKYPDSLDNLVPEFLTNLPRDPKSGENYSYKPLDTNTNYQLCTSFELQQQECVNALPASSSIPIVPTPTSIQPYVPQTATGTPATNGSL